MSEYFLSKDVLVFHLTILNNMNEEKGESMQRIISDYKKFFTAWNKMHHDKFSPFIYSKNLWMYSLEKTE